MRSQTRWETVYAIKATGTMCSLSLLDATEQSGEFGVLGGMFVAFCSSHITFWCSCSCSVVLTAVIRHKVSGYNNTVYNSCPNKREGVSQLGPVIVCFYQASLSFAFQLSPTLLRSPSSAHISALLVLGCSVPVPCWVFLSNIPDIALLSFTCMLCVLLA